MVPAHSRRCSFRFRPRESCFPRPLTPRPNRSSWVRLRPAQRELLRLPLHLVLLPAVADQERALEFGTAKELFDAFWQRKRRDAERMSASQRLSVALAALDEAA
jgi:hypothetical protein